MEQLEGVLMLILHFKLRCDMLFTFLVAFRLIAVKVAK